MSTKLDAGLLLRDLARLVTARATGEDLKQQRRVAAGLLPRRVKLNGMCSLSSLTDDSLSGRVSNCVPPSKF
ncbi:hypothetical protein NL676_035327 [Syzygium grande]|nr:hypothetical protein NL676_035327 [Syzygium grande]